jgi:hypothetical protein
MTVKYYPINSVCTRCGIDKKEFRKTKRGCPVENHTPATGLTHSWNKTPMDVQVEKI